jgi:hypothetical protein
MELKTTLNFEITKNERTYRVIIPIGAPYGEVYDAVFSCLQGIIEHQQKSIEQMKTQQASQNTQGE